MALLHSLTDNDLKELIPLLGERKRIQAALSKSIPTKEATSFENMVFILYQYILYRKHFL